MARSVHIHSAEEEGYEKEIVGIGGIGRGIGFCADAVFDRRGDWRLRSGLRTGSGVCICRAAVPRPRFLLGGGLLGAERLAEHLGSRLLGTSSLRETGIFPSRLWPLRALRSPRLLERLQTLAQRRPSPRAARE